MYSRSLDALPEELILEILNKVTDLPSFVALSRVNRALHRISTNSYYFGTQSFFKSHYNDSIDAKQFIIAPEKLTLRCIREGNRLSHLLTHLLLKKDMLAAEKLLHSAAYLYGSPFAMQLFNMLAMLPGRIQKPIFEEKLITQYKDLIIIKLDTIFKKHFKAPDWPYCGRLLSENALSASKIIQLFITFYKNYYLQTLGINISNCDDAYNAWASCREHALPQFFAELASMYEGTALIPRALSSHFNAAEFFGFDSVLTPYNILPPNCWFESELESKEEDDFIRVMQSQPEAAKKLSLCATENTLTRYRPVY